MVAPRICDVHERQDANDILTQLSRLDPLCLAGALVISGLFFLLTLPRRSSIPMVNEKSLFQIRSSHAQKRFLQDARNLIKAELSRWRAPIFRVHSDNGIKTMLAPECANEIRAHPALSFGRAITLEFHSDIHGFEPFNQLASSNDTFQDAIRMKLTQNLGSVTKPFSDETSIVLKKHWSNDGNWHEVALKPTILKIVAQLSSKVFLGDKICRNPDWLQITVDYTVDTFLAAEDLRLWPRFIRPVVANFLPSCRKIRRELKEATEIITPGLEAARKANQPPKRYNDAMQWMEECAKGQPYSPAEAQTAFSIVAIHTTSDMLTQVVLYLCTLPEVIQPLREEIVALIQEGGWKKTALYKLKLMDSVLKESQRMKRVNINKNFYPLSTSTRRLALEDIKLSGGTLIPKGSSLLVSSHKRWDPDTPGHETSAQLVSPSPEHLGFGYGKHACPGRSFAANEVKIALCPILLNYNFKLPDGCTQTVRKRGISLSADPSAKLVIRQRQEEIAL
ncbi:putative cytochrome P450 monooxygenase [Aspergillus novofumigatus IBT 16806]|uniref:Cytochrome P450 n=1 Tax=Aspergillus novofumigatus (strain IBT 16806) TaxID=1392255 RepID=A0A2I1C5T2_ASPN1|nr:cytochrome P450 [Aspergillus novofumigatus IBT 16806]PKX92974.1 cytochrome P450 [Aspergillus novofumigatus IBT 16806]